MVIDWNSAFRSSWDCYQEFLLSNRVPARLNSSECTTTFDISAPYLMFVRRLPGFFIWMGCISGTNKNCLDEGYTLTGSPGLIDSEIKAIVYPHLTFACGLLLYILLSWIIVPSWNYKSTVEWCWSWDFFGFWLCDAFLVWAAPPVIFSYGPITRLHQKLILWWWYYLACHGDFQCLSKVCFMWSRFFWIGPVALLFSILSLEHCWLIGFDLTGI